MNLARLTFLLAIPTQLVVEEEADEPGGLPKKLGQIPRVSPESSVVVDGCVATLRQSDIEYPLGPGMGVAELHLRVPAESFESALSTGAELTSTLIDRLSFELQSPIHTLQVHALDVSAPLQTGTDRECLVDPGVNERVAGLFFRGQADFQWQAEVVHQADLGIPPPLDSKPRLALWWYLKSLYTPYIVDQFLFLWTSFEVFSPLPGATEEGPIVPRCGHVLEACPECGVSTSRLVMGPSHQASLVQLGVRPEDAKSLWRIRQVVHGANRFKTLEDVHHIGSLVQILRAAVLNLLKGELKIPAWEGPIIQRVDGPVTSTPWVMGSQQITTDDIELESLQSSMLHA